MTENLKNRGFWVSWVLVILLSVLLMAPKKEKAPKEKTPKKEKTEAAAPQPLTIQEIQAEADKVTLTGSGPLQAAAFILGDPIRLRVDVKGAALAAGVPASIPVGGDPIQTISVSALPGGTAPPTSVRLELALTRDVAYQLQPSGNSLVIALTPRQAEAPKEVSEDVYEQAKEIEETLYATGKYNPPPSGIKIPPEALAGAQPAPGLPPAPEPSAPLPAAPPPLPPSAPPVLASGTATQVLDILYRVSETKIQVLIKTNGGVGNYSPQALNNPNRLMIDLPGLKEACPKKTFPISQSGIKAVRVGAHPDKTRVVIDFSGPLPAYSFARAKQGLVITFSLP